MESRFDILPKNKKEDNSSRKIKTKTDRKDIYQKSKEEIFIKELRKNIPFLVENSEGLRNISGFYENKKVLDYQIGNPLGKSESLK
ncbi:10454_t:CDS:2, partial [Gigaspora margarita]